MHAHAYLHFTSPTRIAYIAPRRMYATCVAPPERQDLDQRPLTLAVDRKRLRVRAFRSKRPYATHVSAIDAAPFMATHVITLAAAWYVCYAQGVFTPVQATDMPVPLDALRALLHYAPTHRTLQTWRFVAAYQQTDGNMPATMQLLRREAETLARYHPFAVVTAV